MQPRKPTAFALVCAAHVLLAWALVSLTAGGMPQALADRLQHGLQLVSVHLVSAPPDATVDPVMRAAEPAPARPAPAWRMLPVPHAAAADGSLRTPRPEPAPILAAAHTSVGTEQATPPGAAPLAATAAEHTLPAPTAQVLPAPTAPPARALSGNEALPLVVAQADRRQCPPAPHPAALRERGIEGAVLLRVKVDVQGRAADVQLVAGSGWRLFDEAALQQVRACRFIPASRGGQAIDSWVEFPVRFALAG